MAKQKSLDYILGMITGASLIIALWACTGNNLSADVQDLARSGAYRRVDRTLDPESMASQAYNTVVEKRDALDQRRRREYLEKYDPGA